MVTICLSIKDAINVTQDMMCMQFQNLGQAHLEHLQRYRAVKFSSIIVFLPIKMMIPSFLCSSKALDICFYQKI